MMNGRIADAEGLAIVATRRGRRTTWHTLRREAARVAPGAGLKRHDAAALDGAHSLEGLVHRFGAGEIVFDPTGAFERARRLVTGARTARQLLGPRLVSLHVLGNGRTVYARARSEFDLERIAPAVGGAFARALTASDFQIAVKVGVDAAPSGALPIECIGARRERIAAAAQRLSAAFAIAGAAFYGLGPETARADEFGVAGERAPSNAEESGRVMRAVMAIYNRAGQLVAGGDDEEGGKGIAQRALDAVRRLRDDADAEPVAVDRVESRPQADRAAEILEVSVAADVAALDATDAAPIYGPAPTPMPFPPATPPDQPATGAVSMTALRDSAVEVGAAAIVRGDQSGAVAQIGAQFETAPAWMLGAQGALGTIDGELAGGVQLSLQRESFAAGTPVAAGVFVSGVQSTAPSGEDFTVGRVGAGVAATIRAVQLVVRGGFATGGGDLEADGGFGRIEGVWFPAPELALGAFAETDPTTGTGVGARVSARPFTGTLANMMIDADAAWHEDGEESFRLGLRWLLGQRESASLRDLRARRGMTPDLMDDLARLPDELDRTGQGQNQAQPYCGDAGNPCPAS